MQQKTKQLQTSFFLTLCTHTLHTSTPAAHYNGRILTCGRRVWSLSVYVILLLLLPSYDYRCLYDYRGSRSKNKNNRNDKTTSTSICSPNIFYPRKHSRWKSHSAATFLFVKISVVDRAQSARDGSPRRSCENTIYRLWRGSQ